MSNFEDIFNNAMPDAKYIELQESFKMVAKIIKLAQDSLVYEGMTEDEAFKYSYALFKDYLMGRM